MKTAIVGIEKRLRLAGVLLIVGLLVEAICLQWARPIAFILLVVVGGATMLLRDLCVSLFAGLRQRGKPGSIVRIDDNTNENWASTT